MLPLIQGLEVARAQPPNQSAAQGQLPQHRRLPAGRSTAATMRLLAQSAFVDEEDRAAFILGFF